MSYVMSVDTDALPGYTKEEKQKTLEYWYEFNIANYYEDLKPWTFETKFVEFSKKEASLFLKKLARGLKLEEEEEESFRCFEQRLSEAIDSIVKTGRKVFIRLSTRSPKDVVDKIPEKVIPLIRKELKKFKSSHPNNDLIAIRRAFAEVLSISDLNSAINLLAFSSRIISDLKRALEYGSENWQIYLVVREFCKVPIEGEFRGFVYNKKLTALSQYYTQCYFPILIQNKERIANSYKTERLHNRLCYIGRWKHQDNRVEPFWKTYRNWFIFLG
eukprot:TRINITY_DN6420_c0_g1_i1.p1 TRINITY_DN6420_c0_g1~~TRINITY_DN6420_c0_g1_i1.p1  ORF type:complete len:287 (-),score=52.20 TRINITY_DN6420_c0_g1_i1:312-1130(-)